MKKFRSTGRYRQKGKDVQQVRMKKDRGENVLTGIASVMERWMNYEELINEKNNTKHRVENVSDVEKK